MAEQKSGVHPDHREPLSEIKTIPAAIKAGYSCEKTTLGYAIFHDGFRVTLRGRDHVCASAIEAWKKALPHVDLTTYMPDNQVGLFGLAEG